MFTELTSHATHSAGSHPVVDEAAVAGHAIFVGVIQLVGRHKAFLPSAHGAGSKLQSDVVPPPENMPWARAAG